MFAHLSLVCADVLEHSSTTYHSWQTLRYAILYKTGLLSQLRTRNINDLRTYIPISALDKKIMGLVSNFLMRSKNRRTRRGEKNQWQIETNLFIL